MLKIRKIFPIYILLFVSVTATFLFTRLERISSSLEFFGDIGRDHLVLLEWWKTGKIPLLGPGISYFPLNLPPLYFYLNYPVFLLSQFSPYTTLLTLIFLYLGAFLLGLRILPSKYRKSIFIVALLISLHPLYLQQNRLPWNPSFVPPFLLTAVFSLLSLLEKYSFKKIIIFCAAVVCCIALSVQTVPAVFILFSFALWQLPHKATLIKTLAITVMVIFSPLIAFEVRHNFFFVKRLMLEVVSQPFTTDMTFKLSQHLKYLWGIEYWNQANGMLILAVVLLVTVTLVQVLKYEKELIFKKQFTSLLILFILAFTLTYIAPFPPNPYDIFGTSVLLFLVISFLPLRFSLVALILLSSIWITSLKSQIYENPTRRTIAQMESCAINICQKEKKPMYLSVEAWHLYHKTPEYQFFFSKYGCTVSDITQNQGWASKMAVIADNATYTHSKTVFNELTLFGQSEEKRIYSCDGNIKVHILEK